MQGCADAFRVVPFAVIRHDTVGRGRPIIGTFTEL